MEVKDTTSGGSFDGDCASVYGTSPIWQSCSPEASKWIEVPTGGSYALENAYWYDEDSANDDMLTAPSDTDPGTPYLDSAISGGEDLRTWTTTSLMLAPSS